MFVARDAELKELRRLYKSGTFQFPVIYGRRRVGKTALLEQFTHDLPAIYFTAVEGDVRVNLRNFSREVYLFQHPDGSPDAAPIFADFYAAFQAVFDLAKDKRLVLVVDEFPYLAKAEPAVSSYLQALVDKNKDSSGLYLVLCGSSLSFMKEQVLDEKSPLYGRRTAQMEIRPFDFFDSRKFLEGMTPADAMHVYGMTGGIPLYLLQFNPAKSLAENVESAFLRPSSILYEEPTNLLKQEVQKAAQYNSVLAAIAGGASQNNEIAQAADVTSAELAYYLKELQRLGLVERELPVIAKERRALYRISDNLFRFWYRFVMPNRPALDRGIVARAKSSIDEHFPAYLGPVFEDVCRQWLWRAYAHEGLDFDFDNIGHWWGNDPAQKAEAEIDIVCVNGKKASAIGECKWRNEAFPKSDLEKLADRRRLVNAPADARMLAFSRSGFTDASRAMAQNDGSVRLLGLAEMVEMADGWN